MTEQLTAQEWFDRTVAHLRSMPGAANEHGFCQYLTSDGNKCAVGIHIPDGHPAQEEDSGIESLVEMYPDLVTVMLPGDISLNVACRLAEAMQECHDTRSSWSMGKFEFEGEKRLARVAKSFGLTLKDKPTQ